MSHATEHFYLNQNSPLTRTSTDFWPMDHRSYAGHLTTNAQIGLWFGEWIMPDWDMFQSRHSYAAYNAAGRALSGGPIYVSDKLGEHDPILLRKLVCTDGTVLLADGPGRPTADTLYRHPGKERLALKLFNRVGTAAFVGIFHPVCAAPADLVADAEVPVVRDTLALTDVPGLTPIPHAVLAHTSGKVSCLAPGESMSVTLQRAEWELFTLAPITNGFAVIGLADKFNSAAGVSEVAWTNAHALSLNTRDGGEFVLWTETRPVQVELDGASLNFEWHSNILRNSVPAMGRVRITFGYPIGSSRTSTS